ncbi:hypothetical protein ACGFSB_35110 [Streptomyces sp. NPDC048441]|uniref:hypothetical protein n=1 Tax=Streptomyces sp. NPDC048441 TaxID=3365552 RepID=UPI00371D2485
MPRRLKIPAAAAALLLILLTACGGGRGGEHRTEACLTGTLTYDHRDAEAGPSKPLVTAPARNANWELWGKASTNSKPHKLSSGITDSGTGRFHACYGAKSGTLPEAHMRFRSSSTESWRVIRNRTQNTEYTFDSAARTDISANQNLGTVKVPAAMSNAWHVVDTLNLLYWKRDNPASDCWTRHQVTGKCDELTFV